MVGKAEAGKPKGRMSSYAFFVQTIREEHKKAHPGEKVVFAEFTKKCAEKWKTMSAQEKMRFEDMAQKDKARYDLQMRTYVPPKGEKKSRKRTKDPNAPKRSLSAFFFFCADERGKVKAKNPNWTVAEVAKDLGRQWEKCPNRPFYEQKAIADKKRYEIQSEQYKQGKTFTDVNLEQLMPAKKAKTVVPQAVAQEEEDDDDEEDDDEEEEEDDDEEEEDEDDE
ncbi:high mobility group protein B1-like [Argopecten irradians]|uniref:high mobility group protein B1-like n=1 Tax=Argopecten irradians TaxID=31199 RepID=UPI003712D18C